MFDEEKRIVIGPSALEHGLEADYIEEMWNDQNIEGFEVERTPPKESNLIVIRFVRQPNGILEMIAEDKDDEYFIFHAQLVPEGSETSLLREAFELYFGL